MIDLSVNYGGLKLKNPIVVASGGISKNIEMMRRAEEQGAAAIVMKTLFEEEYARKNPAPCFKLIRRKSGPQRATSFYTFEQASPFGPERYAEEVSKAVKQLSIPVIASINCVNDSSWSTYSRLLEDSGASAIEINRSCPYSTVATSGKEMWTSLAADTIKRVKESVSLPVFIKLTPQLSDPLGAALLLEEAGADAMVFFSRFTGLEIDTSKEEPVMHGGIAGHGGLWSLHYALRWIASAYPVTKTSVIGSGGVGSGEDIVKHLLCGATAVQVCTAIYTEGFGVLAEYLDYLKKFMEEKGYHSLEDFRGNVCEKIIPTSEVKRGGSVVASINREKCNRCGNCFDVCLYDAVDYSDQGYLINNKCCGCGLCLQICPRACITLV